MTPPPTDHVRESPPLPGAPRTRPVLRPESPAPSRPEGIVQAIQAWLDAQL